MMDADAKKTALRMIPYGIYVLTAESPGGETAAATVNWVTQASFTPPLVVVGVKADSGAHAVIKQSKRFALNILGKGQQDIAFKFFKSVAREGDRIAGEALLAGAGGTPLLASAAATVEARVVEIVERGDHSVVIGEVTDARVARAPAGRADDAVLLMKDLGEKVFYGG
jgi:flavin reductase (DIM6/NTAB) family NADH-FMN oxidoreductase RutF